MLFSCYCFFVAIDVFFSPQHSEDAFFVADLGDIIIKYQTWKELLPRVDPFYGMCHYAFPKSYMISANHITRNICGLKAWFGC